MKLGSAVAIACSSLPLLAQASTQNNNQDAHAILRNDDGILDNGQATEGLKESLVERIHDVQTFLRDAIRGGLLMNEDEHDEHADIHVFDPAQDIRDTPDTGVLGKNGLERQLGQGDLGWRVACNAADDQCKIGFYCGNCATCIDDSCTFCADLYGKSCAEYVKDPDPDILANCQCACEGSCGGGDSGGGGASGDPHFRTWNGEIFDFMGACDLVLLRADAFSQGQGLEIQIRTENRRTWSSVGSAAIRIGSDVLEVHQDGTFFLNGEANVDLFTTHANLAGYPIHWEMGTAHGTAQKFSVDLGAKGVVSIKLYYTLVDVVIEDALALDFGSSVGMMGSFQTGTWLARDQTTVMDDPDLFGMEWQVLDTEESLFVSLGDGPQFPEMCLMADHESLEQRRLSNDAGFVKAAEDACSAWEEGMRDACLFDVLATGNLNIAYHGGHLF